MIRLESTVCVCLYLCGSMRGNTATSEPVAMWCQTILIVTIIDGEGKERES